MEKFQDLYNIVRNGAGASIDTRTLQPGNIFFALKGEKVDGHNFVRVALDQGAGAVVVSDPDYVFDERCFLFEDVLKTMQNLANRFRQDLESIVLAITGSNGKTTNKNLLAKVLGRKFKVSATRGNFNNHIGVPLTLLNSPVDTEFLILEMGTNHFGEIRDLCQIGEPDFGSILNIGKSHLEFLGSEEGVLKAKSELADFLVEMDGFLFMNREEKSILPLLDHTVKKILFDRNHLPGEEIVSLEVNQVIPTVEIGVESQRKTYMVHSVLWGAHNARNIIHAFGVGLYFGVPVSEIVKAAEDYRPDNHRSQVIEVGGKQIYLDSYNANPTSMEMSVKGFGGSFPIGGVVVLGDMGELGASEIEEHQRILGLLSDFSFRKIVLIGKIFEEAGFPSFPDYEYYRSTSDFKGDFKKLLTDPTVKGILIKGSRMMTLEKLLEGEID